MEIYSYRIGVLIPQGSDADQLPDVTGYDVEATDGSIGKVDEASYEDASSCLVVDTGFWIFGKKRMIPAGAVASIDTDERRVQVSLSKDEIKKAPDYNEKRRNDTDERQHQEDYYGPLSAHRSGR